MEKESGEILCVVNEATTKAVLRDDNKFGEKMSFF